MSSNKVISEVSQLLQKILSAGLETLDDNDVSVKTVVGQSPVDFKEGDKPALMLWLYQVTPNAYLRNAPNIRVRGEESENITPLSLDLFYLLTPFQDSEVVNHQILGRALQVLYDNSVLPLHAGKDIEELHINICQRSIEELAKVWEATKEAYRLSVCFEVRVVKIDSERKPPAGRIRDRATDFEDKPVEVEA